MSIIHRKDHKPVAWHLPRVFRALWPPVIVILGVITVFWKLALTSQYTFVAGGDLANMVVPRLQPAISAIRHGSIFLWNPYEWFGEPPIGQVQPGITSPFTYLLALAPLQDGQIQLFWVYKWFVALHCIAGLFAWRFLRDLDARLAQRRSAEFSSPPWATTATPVGRIIWSRRSWLRWCSYFFCDRCADKRR